MTSTESAAAEAAPAAASRSSDTMVPQLPAGFEHLELRLWRDADDADVVVGDRRDQSGHRGAVAQQGGGRCACRKEGVRAHDPSGQIRMLRIDAGVDEGDAHACALGALVGTGDAERRQIGLQVIERVVIRSARRGRIAEGVKLLQRLRQHDARILRQRGEHLGDGPPVGDLVHHAMHRQSLDRPACHLPQGVRGRHAARLLLRALRHAVAVPAVVTAGGAGGSRCGVRLVGERHHDPRRL